MQTRVELIAIVASFLLNERSVIKGICKEKFHHPLQTKKTIYACHSFAVGQGPTLSAAKGLR